MQTYQTLVEVNREVNALPYKTDAELYDRLEYWTDAAVATGADCEDYAITKMHKLATLGWPQKSLRLATCYTETGEFHGVLIVSTEDGDYMLDNRQPNPVPVADVLRLGYKPASIQASGLRWVQWL